MTIVFVNLKHFFLLSIIQKLITASFFGIQYLSIMTLYDIEHKMLCMIY